MVRLQVENRKLQTRINELRERLLKFEGYRLNMEAKLKSILETQKETTEIIKSWKTKRSIICPECGIKLTIGEFKK